MINWPRHCISSPCSNFWKFSRSGIRIPNECRTDRRQLLQTGIVLGKIHRFLGIKEFAHFTRFIIELAVWIVVANEQGISEITRLAGLVQLIISSWSFFVWLIISCIRTNITPIQKSCFSIHRYPVGVSCTHGINLRSCFGGAWRKKISFRN